MYKIIKSFRGTNDGFTVINFSEGETVDMSDSLAKVAIDEGWAEKMISKVSDSLAKVVYKVAPTKKKAGRKKRAK